MKRGFSIEQIRKLTQTTGQVIPELEELTRGNRTASAPKSAAPKPAGQRAPRRLRESLLPTTPLPPAGPAEKIVIVWPGVPPSWNALSNTGTTRERIQTIEAEKDRAETGLADVWPMLRRYSVPVNLTYTIYRSDAARCDRDNLVTKYLTDSLVRAGVIPSDTSAWVSGPWPALVAGTPARTVLVIEPQSIPAKETTQPVHQTPRKTRIRSRRRVQ